MYLSDLRGGVVLDAVETSTGSCRFRINGTVFKLDHTPEEGCGYNLIEDACQDITEFKCPVEVVGVTSWELESRGGVLPTFEETALTFIDVITGWVVLKVGLKQDYPRFVNTFIPSAIEHYGEYDEI